MSKGSISAGKIAKTAKDIALFFNATTLPKTIIEIIFTIIFFGILIYLGLPWYIGITFMILISAILSLGIIITKRILSAKLSNPTPKKSVIAYPNEKIITYIAGIMRTGFGIRGKSILGVGEIYNSENAMIITNKRILLITVPVPGAETTIEGIDIPMWQWLLAKKDIKNKTKEMIKSMSIADILRSNRKNFFIDYNDIKTIKFGNISRSIKIIRKDGKKFEYAIRDKRDFERAKKIFVNFS